MIQIKSDNTFVQDYVIYGAGEAGRQIYSSLDTINKKVFCFIDDDIQKQAKTLFGKRIVSQSTFQGFLKIKKFNNLIIAIPTLSKKNFLKIQNNFKNKIKNIEFIPLKNKLKSDFITLSDLSNLEIDTIIRRKSKLINYNKVEKEFKKKNILITGGCGSIGSQLCRNLLNTKSSRIVILDNSEINLFQFKNEMKRFKKVKFYLGDILDTQLLKSILEKEKINIIFHTAAYKHVNILENNVHSAIRNNILGTKNLLEVSKNFKKMSVITVSTDKAVKPKNILGITKRISELIAIGYNSKLFDSKVVRFGNVFGSNGSAIPTFIKQINENIPITITDLKAKRYFMTISEACFLLMSSVKIKDSKNVLILNMGKPIKIIDVINNLIKLKKKLNRNHKFKIKKVGLKKGEKLNEQLSISKKLKKSNVEDIKMAFDPIYELKSLNDLIKFIEQSANNNKKLKKIKLFLKKESSI